MKVFIKKLHKDAVIPKYAFDSDAGCDVSATSMKETDDYIEYGIGLAFEVDKFEGNGWYIKGCSRSSISKYDLILSNGVGRIDNGYRNEVTFRFKKIKCFRKELKCVTDKIYEIWKDKHIMSLYDIFEFIKNYNFDEYKVYNIGDKIGQLMLEKRPKIEFVEVDDLSTSDRNMGGYGHTGK